MPLFRRKPKEIGRPSAPLPPDEAVERGTEATLLQGKEAMKGRLWLTNYRLLFEAKKGRARWMVVPFKEVRSAGLYPWSRGGLGGGPASRQQCLMVETTLGEQVWWDFGEQEEREWLPLVQERIPAAHERAGEAE